MVQQHQELIVVQPAQYNKLMANIPIYIPTYINSVDYTPAKVQPRLLFYNGMLDCESYYIESASAFGGVAREQTKFPYFDNYNVVTGSFPTVDSTSILFFNEESVYGQTPTDTLYSDYWSKYVELLYNPRTKLLNASAIIPLADYFKISQNDIVQFRGNYYHLRAINDYNLKNGECSIQLLGPILPDSLNLNRFYYENCMGYSISICADACLDYWNNCGATYYYEYCMGYSAIDCSLACIDNQYCPTTTTSTTTTTMAPLSPVVQAFVTASGITGSAVNYVQTLYTELTTANLFNKMYAIYPFVGANATSHRYNLVNTGSYTITFNGPWVHNSNGITGNGTNTYANTFLIPNTFNAGVPDAYPGDMWFVSSSMHVYSRTDGASGVDMGSYIEGNAQSILIAKYNSGSPLSTTYANTQGSVAIEQSNATGFFGGSVLATTIYNNQGNIVSGSASGSNGVYKNGVKLRGFEQPPYNGSGFVSSVPLYIGANNDGTGPLEFTNRNYAFAAIGKGLTQNEMATFYTIVQNFETSLNRQV